MNYVYLLRCADDSLYCGWTTDLPARLEAHNSGRGAKYTRSRRPVELVYYECWENRSAALSREWHLKRLRREEKLELIRREGKTTAVADINDALTSRRGTPCDPQAVNVFAAAHDQILPVKEQNKDGERD